MNYDKDKWAKIAQNYMEERLTKSNSAILLDKLIFSYFKNDIQYQKKTVLDYGAGSGAQTIEIAKYSSNVVAYEPICEMRELIINNSREISNIHIISEIYPKDYEKKFDIIVCSKVLDHVADISSVLLSMHIMLKENGVLLLTVPHPIKYSGDWILEKNNALYYKIDHYFNEGVIYRNRINSLGTMFLENFKCHHRTVSTYFMNLIEAGFLVKKLLEPFPSHKNESNQLKTSTSQRIPNSLFFECHKV
jgi:2-polyprenyl-3-methyl-5-hydroxy-6-metoxy-1,4-benzoquinol methylase